MSNKSLRGVSISEMLSPMIARFPYLPMIPDGNRIAAEEIKPGDLDPRVGATAQC